MKHLSDRYVRICNHKGYDICTLKAAEPANGDELGYVIDDEKFTGQVFNSTADAIAAIVREEENQQDTSRAYTKEEVRDMFLNEIICLAGYWEKDKGTPNVKDKLQGLAFSILSMLDGESGSLPGFTVMVESDEEDIEYAKERQSKYFPLESEDIAGNLHERFLALCKEWDSN